MTAPRRLALGAPWAAFAVAALVHVGSLSNGFANDDRDIVLENERVHSLARLPEAVSMPYWPIEFGADMGLWRPATTAAYALQWWLFDGSPLLFHLVNVLLHALVAALVVLLAARLLPPPGPLVAGLVFAVHPVHVEAVANVVGFAELASAAAFLLACVLFLRWRGALTGGRIGLLAALYAVTVLFKESGVVLPLALLLLDTVRNDSSAKTPLRALRDGLPLGAALAAVAVILLGLRAMVLGGIRPPLPPVGAELLEEIPRIFTVAAVWPEYARLLLFPWELAGDYSPGRVRLNTDWTVSGMLGVALVLGVLGAAWGAWRSGRAVQRRGGEDRWRRPAALGLLWIPITLFTTANLAVLTGVLLAERTLYLPSVGLCITLGALAAAVLGPVPAGYGARTAARAVAASLALVVLIGSLRTVERVPVWKDTETMWLDVVRQQPENGRSHWVLGDALWMSGDRPAALRAYGRAVGLLDGDQLLLTTVAQRLLEAGRPAQAEVLARQAWEKRPGYDAAPGLLAVALLAQGRSNAAIAPALASLEADPADPAIHMLLAQAYRQSNRTLDALERQREAIRLGGGSDEGDWGPWRTLAELELAAGFGQRARAASDSARVRGAPGPGVRQNGSDLGLTNEERRSR